MEKRPLSVLVMEKMRSGKKSSPEAEPEEMGGAEEEDEMDEGLQAAAEEVMAALEASDARGFMEALKSFIEQC